MTWQLYNKQGKIHNTKETYGYNYNPAIRNFEVNEKEAETVQMIFRMYLEGCGFGKISRFLNENGYPSKRNALWCNRVIKGMLANEFYLGHLIQGKLQTIDVTIKKQERVDKSKWYIHKNNHEAIVSEELFYKVQAEFEKRAEYMVENRHHSSAYLFSNLIRCKICDYSGVPKKNYRNDSIYYACSAYEHFGLTAGHRRNAITEKNMIIAVKSSLEMLADDDYKIIKNYYRQGSGDIDKEAEKLTIASVDKLIDEQTRLSLTLLNAFNEGILGKNQFKLQNEAIEEELNSLMLQREELLYNQNKTAIKFDGEGETVKAVKALLEIDVSQWSNVLLKRAINKIHIDMPNNDIEILFHYNTSAK